MMVVFFSVMHKPELRLLRTNLPTMQMQCKSTPAPATHLQQQE